MFDLVLQNGTIYDGSGSPGYQGDLAIQGDQIAAISAPGVLGGKTMIDAGGLAVAPGFINMLSWAVESLIEDGRSQSEIRQGVTLEVMGEGTSMGPLSDGDESQAVRGILGNADIQYDVDWTTLGEYLEFLEKRGVSLQYRLVCWLVHAARFTPSATRIARQRAAELDADAGLVREAMQEGAVGHVRRADLSPGSYAETDELIALAQVAAEYGGMYISHICAAKAGTLLEALDEFIAIADAGRDSRRNLSPESGGRGQLGQDGRRDPPLSKRRGRRDCRSRRTCIPIPPAAPACRLYSALGA